MCPSINSCLLGGYWCAGVALCRCGARVTSVHAPYQPPQYVFGVCPALNESTTAACGHGNGFHTDATSYRHTPLHTSACATKKYKNPLQPVTPRMPTTNPLSSAANVRLCAEAVVWCDECIVGCFQQEPYRHPSHYHQPHIHVANDTSIVLEVGNHQQMLV